MNTLFAASMALLLLSLLLKGSYEYSVNKEDLEADQVVPRTQLVQRTFRDVVRQNIPGLSIDESPASETAAAEGSGDEQQSPQQQQQETKGMKSSRNARESVSSGAEAVSSAEHDSSGEEPVQRLKRNDQTNSSTTVQIEQQRASGEQLEEDSALETVNEAENSKEKRSLFADEGSGQEMNT